MTPLQIVKIQLIGDSLDARNKVLIDSMTVQVKRMQDSIAKRPVQPADAAPAPAPRADSVARAPAIAQAAPPTPEQIAARRVAAGRPDDRPGGQGGQGRGGPGGPAGPFQQIQPILQQARNNYLAAVESIKGVLTEEQWNKLPEAFRNPARRARPGGPGGQGRPQRPPQD